MQFYRQDLGKPEWTQRRQKYPLCVMGVFIGVSAAIGGLMIMWLGTPTAISNSIVSKLMEVLWWFGTFELIFGCALAASSAIGCLLNWRAIVELYRS